MRLQCRQMKQRNTGDDEMALSVTVRRGAGIVFGRDGAGGSLGKLRCLIEPYYPEGRQRAAWVGVDECSHFIF